MREPLDRALNGRSRENDELLAHRRFCSRFHGRFVALSVMKCQSRRTFSFASRAGAACPIPAESKSRETLGGIRPRASQRVEPRALFVDDVRRCLCDEAGRSELAFYRGDLSLRFLDLLR